MTGGDDQAAEDVVADRPEPYRIEHPPQYASWCIIDDVLDAADDALGLRHALLSPSPLCALEVQLWA